MTKAIIGNHLSLWMPIRCAAGPPLGLFRFRTGVLISTPVVYLGFVSFVRAAAPHTPGKEGRPSNSCKVIVIVSSKENYESQHQ